MIEDYNLKHGVGAAQIEIGSIGWEDEDDFIFLGSDDNDGYTFIRVQLFRGRDITQPLNPTRAQGIKLLCHVNALNFRTPKKDTRCYVALPAGMESMPGAGVIVATVEKSPPQLQADRAVMDFGDDTHVVIRGKSVSLQDGENRFLSVGTPRSGGDPGILFQAANGTGGVITETTVSWFVAKDGAASSLIQMTDGEIDCMSTKGGMWKIDANFYCLGGTNTVAGGAVYLGKLPTIASPVLYGLTGIAGVASLSVFVSAA